MGLRRWSISLAALAAISGVITVLTASGVIRIVGVTALVAVMLFLAITWYLGRRRIPQLAPTDFLPKAPYRIEPATEEDILWIADTAKRVYSGIDVIPVGQMLEWFEANPAGFSVIKDRDGHRCGNIDLLPLKPDTLSRFLKGDLIERDIRGDSLFRSSESHKIDTLYVESVVALTEGNSGNPLAAYKCVVSAPQLIKRVCNPCKMERLYAIGASEGGVRLMERLGFDRIDYGKERKDGHSLFVVALPDFCKNIALMSEGQAKSEVLSLLRSMGEDPAL